MIALMLGMATMKAKYRIVPQRRDTYDGFALQERVFLVFWRNVWWSTSPYSVEDHLRRRVKPARPAPQVGLYDAEGKKL